MSRVLFIAGAMLMVAASAEAKPVWRTYPTALPAQTHLTKVRPAWLGPVWRQSASPRIVTVDFAPAARAPIATVASPTPVLPIAVAKPIAAAPVANADTSVITWKPTPAPVAIAVADPVPPPAPKIAEKLPAAAPRPAPIVVAENKTAQPPSVALPAIAPPPDSSTPWGQILLGIVFAAAVAAAIFLLGRDRTSRA